MTLVIDTSVVVKWIVPEANSDLAQLYLDAGPLTAPDLLRAELVHTLTKKVRRREITSEQAIIGHTLCETALLFLPSMDLSRRALELSLGLRHPAYDCFFLALTESINGTLITADERLALRCASTPFASLIKLLA